MNLLRELSHLKLSVNEADEKYEDDQEDNEPKVLGKAGDYTVELDIETEQITIKGVDDEIVTTMPYVIWKELKRI